MSQSEPRFINIYSVLEISAVLCQQQWIVVKYVRCQQPRPCTVLDYYSPPCYRYYDILVKGKWDGVFLCCADQCLTIKFALLCFVNRRTTCGPVYLWILRKSNMTAKIESKGTFSNAVAKTSYCPSCNPCLFFWGWSSRWRWPSVCLP